VPRLYYRPVFSQLASTSILRHRFGFSTQECQQFKSQSVIHCRLLGLIRYSPCHFGHLGVPRQMSDKSTVVSCRHCRGAPGSSSTVSHCGPNQIGRQTLPGVKSHPSRTWNRSLEDGIRPHPTLHEIGCA